jgi:hypothetical protein
MMIGRNLSGFETAVFFQDYSMAIERVQLVSVVKRSVTKSICRTPKRYSIKPHKNCCELLFMNEKLNIELEKRFVKLIQIPQFDI